MPDNNVYTRAQLKKWFKNGCKPTENHFAAAFDSFLHKDDAIPAANVQNLAQLLQNISGLTPEQAQAMIDLSIAAHDADPSAHNIGTLQDFAAPFN